MEPSSNDLGVMKIGKVNFAKDHFSSDETSNTFIIIYYLFFNIKFFFEIRLTKERGKDEISFNIIRTIYRYIF